MILLACKSDADFEDFYSVGGACGSSEGSSSVGVESWGRNRQFELRLVGQSQPTMWKAVTYPSQPVAVRPFEAEIVHQWIQDFPCSQLQASGKAPGSAVMVKS